MDCVLRAQVVQAVLAPVPGHQMIVPVLVPAQAPARAQVLAHHPGALAQVQALPLQAVPALAPALVQAQVLAQAPHLHTAPVPAHLRVNPTVSTKNMTHTDLWVHPPVAPAQVHPRAVPAQALVPPHQAVQVLAQVLQAAQALPSQAVLAQAPVQALPQVAQVHPPAVQALAQVPALVPALVPAQALVKNIKSYGN